MPPRLWRGERLVVGENKSVAVGGDGSGGEGGSGAGDGGVVGDVGGS